MQIGNIKAVKYWRKSFSIEAIRLTKDNMRQIADFLGAEYCTKTRGSSYINYGGDEGYTGEWLIKHGGVFRFLGDEEFQKAYMTHSEQVSEDAKYARIFQLVASAMAKQDAATFQQDQTGMDLLVIETVKKIIGEL